VNGRRAGRVEHELETEPTMTTYYLNPQQARWADWYMHSGILSDAAKLTHAEEQVQNAHYLGSFDAELVWHSVVSMLRSATPAVHHAHAS
jgi:hypothetical protein